MRENLKVLMVVTSLNYWRRGGVSRHAFELSKALNKQGCRIYVSCMDKPENRVVDMKDCGLVSCFPVPLFDFVSFNINMLRKMRNYDVDIIHSQAGHGFIFAMAKEKPFIVTVHGSPSLVMKNVTMYRYHVYPRFMHLTEGYAIRRADKVIAVSKEVADLIQTEYGVEKEKIVCIPNGVDAMKFNPYLDANFLREKYDVHGPLLLCVSRLGRDRFVDRLIPMVKKVAKEVPDVKLIIVGDGPFKFGLEKLRNQEGLSKRVILAGAKNDSELPYFYAAADLCVVPVCYTVATKEFTVLEAMACGKTVIYVRRAGYKGEAMNNPIEVKSDEDLASSMIDLLQDDRKRKVLGLAARKIVIENFSWKVIAERTAEVYKSFI